MDFTSVPVKHQTGLERFEDVILVARPAIVDRRRVLLRHLSQRWSSTALAARPRETKLPSACASTLPLGIEHAGLDAEHVAALPGYASAHFDRLLERNRFAKTHVHACGDAAMAGKSRRVRHRLVEQRHHDAAVRDSAPALVLRRRARVARARPPRRRRGRNARACRSDWSGPHAKQLPSSNGTSLTASYRPGSSDRSGMQAGSPRASCAEPSSIG